MGRGFLRRTALDDTMICTYSTFLNVKQASTFGWSLLVRTYSVTLHSMERFSRLHTGQEKRSRILRGCVRLRTRHVFHTFFGFRVKPADNGMTPAPRQRVCTPKKDQKKNSGVKLVRRKGGALERERHISEEHTCLQTRGSGGYRRVSPAACLSSSSTIARVD